MNYKHTDARVPLGANSCRSSRWRLSGLASIEDFIEHEQITQNYDGGH